jgi:hypothetical protein
MVRFLLYLGFGLESFGNISKRQIFAGSHLLYKIVLMPDSHMSDER